MKICSMADECSLNCAHKTIHETNELEKILLWTWQGKRCDKECSYFEGSRCINVADKTCKDIYREQNILD